MNLPLAGITVLDLTQIYNGPYATFMMARAGAARLSSKPATQTPERNKGIIMALLLRRDRLRLRQAAIECR